MASQGKTKDFSPFLKGLYRKGPSLDRQGAGSEGSASSDQMVMLVRSLLANGPATEDYLRSVLFSLEPSHGAITSCLRGLERDGIIKLFQDSEGWKYRLSEQ